jgi:hypothetical protein
VAQNLAYGTMLIMEIKYQVRAGRLKTCRIVA